MSVDPSPPAAHSVTLSPVQDSGLENDVFLRRDDIVDHASHAATASCRGNHLQSSEEEYFEPTPPPMKSFVNNSRGNPRFGGPAASLMKHIGWRYSMHTIQGVGSSDGIEEEEGDKSNMVRSTRKDEDLPEEEVTVNIACICGNDQMTSSQVIQCDNCAMFFHRPGRSQGIVI